MLGYVTGLGVQMILSETSIWYTMYNVPYLMMVSPSSDMITIRVDQHTQHCLHPTQTTLSTSIFDQTCSKCSHSIREPYINCSECRQLFCLPCFSRGSETEKHRNTHQYSVRTDDTLTVFENSNWSATEEKRLLDALQLNGYGNWTEIGRTMRTRSAAECEHHYRRFYFDGVFGLKLGLRSCSYEPERTPYWYKMNSVEPPRHDADDVAFNRLAGYRCARADFDVPYDNSAESIVSHLDLSWSDAGADYESIGDQLNAAIFTAYNHRLR